MAFVVSGVRQCLALSTMAAGLHIPRPTGARIHMNPKHKRFPLMNPAGEGEDGGGSDAITPEVQALIDAQVAQQVAGLRAKNGELIAANKEIKAKFQGLSEQLEGFDIEAVKGLLSKASTDEDTRLLAEGKAEELVTRRTERLRAEYEKKLQAEAERANAAEKLSATLREQTVAAAIRDAANKAGALPEASDDFVFRSRGMFSFNEDGEVVALDKDGQVIFGKDGATPMRPSEWADSLRDSAPHLFPRATGAGAMGNPGGKATKSFHDMTEAEHRELYLSNPDKFKQMAAAANTPKA